MEGIQVGARREARNCPYCRAALLPEEAVTGCRGCDARYHTECWAELGGCATLGCLPRGDPHVSARPRARPGGPRIGAQRYCYRCGDRFHVRADNRYSAFCAACARRRVGKAVLLFLVVAPLFLVLNYWPMLIQLFHHVFR